MMDDDVCGAAFKTTARSGKATFSVVGAARGDRTTDLRRKVRDGLAGRLWVWVFSPRRQYSQSLPHSAFAPLFAHPIPALQAIGLFLHHTPLRDFFRMNGSGRE